MMTAIDKLSLRSKTTAAMSPVDQGWYHQLSSLVISYSLLPHFDHRATCHQRKTPSHLWKPFTTLANSPPPPPLLLQPVSPLLRLRILQKALVRVRAFVVGFITRMMRCKPVSSKAMPQSRQRRSTLWRTHTKLRPRYRLEIRNQYKAWRATPSRKVQRLPCNPAFSQLTGVPRGAPPDR